MKSLDLGFRILGLGFRVGHKDMHDWRDEVIPGFYGPLMAVGRLNQDAIVQIFCTAVRTALKSLDDRHLRTNPDARVDGEKPPLTETCRRATINMNTRP